MDKGELIDNFTKHEVETVESILRCMKQPPTPAKFRRMVMLFLRGHYSSPENYMGFDHLNCYYWDPDDGKTKLWIGFTHQDNDKNPDAYPGIYVSFAKVDLSRGGIGGNFAGNSQDMAGTNVSKDAKLVLTVDHVAAQADHAYDLAELSSRVLTAMAGPLITNSGASSFEVLGYAPPDEKNPSPEKYYTVAMPIEISYTHAVTRSLESHRIRRIAQVMDAEN